MNDTIQVNAGQPEPATRQVERRKYPRIQTAIPVEFVPDGSEVATHAQTSDISLGGCYVETSSILSPGTKLKLVFSIDDGQLHADGTVTRIDPGTGVAVQFKELTRENRDHMHRVLEYLQNTSTYYDNRYLSLINR